jgi:large subunit ribosomal protein L25
MTTIIKVSGKPRMTLGTTACRRLRTQGRVPAVVYGHKQNPAQIVLEGEQIGSIVRSGARVVQLEVDGKTEQALIKDVQWDTFSSHLMHIDFLRVDKDERIKIEIPLQLRGTSPGVVSGGVLEMPHHTVMVECLAVDVPDFIIVRIGSLQIGGAVHVSELTDVPPGVTILTPPDTLLVHVVVPKVAPEPVAEAAAEAAAQPELVTPPGKEKEKDESGKSG